MSRYYYLVTKKFQKNITYLDKINYDDGKRDLVSKLDNNNIEKKSFGQGMLALAIPLRLSSYENIDYIHYSTNVSCLSLVRR